MTPPSAVCAGEMTIDVISVAGDASGRGERHVGGSPVNVAAGLRARGFHATVWSAVGADESGQLALARLQALGLSTEAVAVDPDHPTRVVHIEIEPIGSRTTRPPSGDTADQFLAAGSLPDELQTCRVFYFSGAALIGSATAAVVLDAARRVRQRPDTIVAFDPNIRLGRSAAADEIRGRLHAALDLADVLQIAAERAPEYFPEGAPSSLDGVPIRIETHGEGGAILHAAGKTIGVPAVPAPAKDTTGAGDAFLASLLADCAASGFRRAEHVVRGLLEAWGRTAATAAARVVGDVGGTSVYLSSADESRS